VKSRAYWSLGGRFEIKAGAAETRNQWCMCEADMTKLAEPPLHVHHTEDEAWYVLSGKLTFHIGERTQEAPPGTFVFAPRNLPHWFTVDEEPARVLVFASPGGAFERIVEQTGVPADTATGPLPPDPAAIAEPLRANGVEILGPPPGGLAGGRHH